MVSAAMSDWVAVFFAARLVEAFDVVFCSAILFAFSLFSCGGARIVGIFGIRTRILRAIVDRFDKLLIALSTWWCLILRSLLYSCKFVCLTQNFGLKRFFKYTRSSTIDIIMEFAFGSSLVPNFAISLMRTVTSNFPGSQTTEVY